MTPDIVAVVVFIIIIITIIISIVTNTIITIIITIFTNTIINFIAYTMNIVVIIRRMNCFCRILSSTSFRRVYHKKWSHDEKHAALSRRE